MAEPAPPAEDRSRYEAIKKELISALPKKRAIDKQLVCKLIVEARVIIADLFFRLK